MWIPLSNSGTSLNSGTVFHEDDGTIGELVALTLTAKLIRQRQLTRTGDSNQIAIFVLNGLDVGQTDSTLVLHNDTVLSSRPRGRTTDVEGTHGQLCTWLTDRLGCDNTNSFAWVNQMTTTQVTTVTLGTNTVTSFAGN